ncbi:uncharacterized protein LOC132407476 [Hypanus sabinus]|uniref:uncharacterized protein LOC132407476 n=1 Tax=Hypanus sabinus TaxID=79690 RepID=UPI0028C397DA|nr:uncharacterized protein LOC132407476 [Hypanus sabinus]
MQCEKFLSKMQSAGSGAYSWLCLLILWPSCSFSQRSECIKLNPCKCIMKDGSGVINLAAVGDDNGFLARDKPLTTKNSEFNILYSFSPCQPFSKPFLFASDCSDVAACLIIRNQAQGKGNVGFLNYGSHKLNEFNYDNMSKILTVTYSASLSSLLQTVVRYNCSSHHSVIASQDPKSPYVLWISVDSPCACPNSCEPQDVGPRTIILVVFSITITAYFLFGGLTAYTQAASLTQKM